MCFLHIKSIFQIRNWRSKMDGLISNVLQQKLKHVTTEKEAQEFAWPTYVEISLCGP